jgi:hypothetical protein
MSSDLNFTGCCRNGPNIRTVTPVVIPRALIAADWLVKFNIPFTEGLTGEALWIFIADCNQYPVRLFRREIWYFSKLSETGFLI